MAIFSGDESKEFWKAVKKAIRKTVGVDILYQYGIKAQNLEAENKARAERITELETDLDNIRLISGASYKLPVTAKAAMKNMKVINKRCERALKG